MNAPSTLSYAGPNRRRGIPGFNRQNLPLIATIAVCALLYLAGALSFDGFASLRVFRDFISENAFLGIAAVGLTFVILSGGIDLSVGAVIGCTSILIATLVRGTESIPAMHPGVVIPLVLLLGVMFGLTQGALIRFFNLPAFLITLAGMFFCRGLGLLVSTKSIDIQHGFFTQTLAAVAIPLNDRLSLPLTGIVFIAVLLVAIYVARSTAFGRNCYALGGSEQSAGLMGLPVGRTKLAVYAVSGFCSALAGVIFTVHTSAGNATAAGGLELDAIAAVVVGGTLLSGGSGSLAGTFFGVLIFGIIVTGINFQGTLSSHWTRIAVGVLLLVFILLQKLIQRKGN
jgi:ribose/xylose/arabinose/galactoside ABC-type transport system permease subunit